MEKPDLTNPKNFHSPINVSGMDLDLLIKFYESMSMIRKAEDLLAVKRRDGFIGGPVHLGAGQEAIPVGVSASLNSSDFVFGAHRSHGHLLALGSSLHKLFAEVLGKETGHSKGMGGSMHLWDEPSGFYGSVPIMAGTVPLAVGAAISAKLRKSSSIAVAYLGDGAVEEGIVIESMNLAKIQKAPILFIVENNLFASHMHISLRQPSSYISRFADASLVPSHILDGNDVVEVFKTARNSINDIRSGQGPQLIECLTYRFYGHVDWREDVDVGVNRSMEDINDWRSRDPIKRLTESLLEINETIEDKLNDLNDELNLNVQSAWELALEDPFPAKDKLLEGVYA